MKDEPRSPSRHQLDHAVPTVIHHPEEDMPVLARWLHRAMENQTRFWGLIVGLVVVVTGLIVLRAACRWAARPRTRRGSELETAKTAAGAGRDRREYPEDPGRALGAAPGGDGVLQPGVRRPAGQPRRRPARAEEGARPLRAGRRASRPRTRPQARAAALGVARTLEARNELDKAIAAVREGRHDLEGTPTRRVEAERLAEALRQARERRLLQGALRLQARRGDPAADGPGRLHPAAEPPAARRPDGPRRHRPVPSPPACRRPPLAPGRTRATGSQPCGLPSDVFAAGRPRDRGPDGAAQDRAAERSVFAPKTEGECPSPTLLPTK